MPACSSCPIDPAIGQLVDAIGEPNVVRPTLLKALCGLPDPRSAHGVRHRIGAIVAVSVCPVVAGARSYSASAQWTKDTGPEEL